MSHEQLFSVGWQLTRSSYPTNATCARFVRTASHCQPATNASTCRSYEQFVSKFGSRALDSAIDLGSDERHWKVPPPGYQKASRYFMALGSRLLDLTPISGRTLKMQSNLVRLLGFRSIPGRLVMLAFALMWLSPACTTANGSLSVTWTIASSSDASLCGPYGATNVALLVNDSSGNQFSRVTLACSAMSTGIPNVPAGTYTVTAQMIDAQGSTISSVIGPISVSIAGGATTTQNLDFPTSAFSATPGTGTLTVNWTIENSTSAAECSKFNASTFQYSLPMQTGKQSDGTMSMLARF